MSEQVKPKRIHKDAHERQQDILLAATKVFSEQGVQAADMQTVADLAGVGKGTVYRYFENKQQLFIRSIELHLDRLRDSVDAASDAQQLPLDKLRAAWSAYLDFFQANPNLIELFRQEHTCSKDGGMTMYLAWIEQRKEKWRVILEAILQQVPAPVLSAEQLMEISEQLIHGAVVLNTKKLTERPVNEQVEMMMQVFQHGFMHDA